MKTPSTLLAALLLALASATHAQTTGNPPPKPVTGEGAAATVSTNPAGTESSGEADEGQATAEKNISKQHRETIRHREREHVRDKGSAQRGERPSAPERPSMPERPGR